MMKRLSKFVLGEEQVANLPARVRAQIDHQQQNSEELIAWVQSLIISFFGLLYTLSPSSAVGLEFAPVPYALAAFFAFCLARLYMTHQQMFPGVLPLIGVVADILLLLTLIWVFQIQYM